MNDTIISINGISVSHTPIKGEQTTDSAHLIAIKDKDGNICYIHISHELITNVQWIRSTK